MYMLGFNLLEGRTKILPHVAGDPSLGLEDTGRVR